MSRSKLGVSRRSFLHQAAAGAAAATIVPRNVLGQGQTPPSEEFGGALIGAGGRGGTTFKRMGPGIRLVAQCDVKYLDRADNKTIYTDYRRVLERNDIHVVAIATPPHWHALISAAAMAVVIPAAVPGYWTIWGRAVLNRRIRLKIPPNQEIIQVKVSVPGVIGGIQRSG